MLGYTSKKCIITNSTLLDIILHWITENSLSLLRGKKILLCLSGSIAIYKSLQFIRILKKAEAEVRCMATHNALEFVKPLMLETLSGKPIISGSLLETAQAGMEHIEAARWAEVMLVYPASANLCSKFAHGMADEIITTSYLGLQCPCLVFPAMNTNMWNHPATQESINKISKHPGTLVCPPQAGTQICGDQGVGNIPEPEEAFFHVLRAVSPQILAGKTIAISAGGTFEPIDSVRYIANRSSGKMGIAIAQAAHALGAEVRLLAINTSLQSFHLKRIECVSHQEVLEHSLELLEDSDWYIAAGAISDFRLLEASTAKLKKQQLKELKLVENSDILQQLSVANSSKKTKIIGFAAESENVEVRAKIKLHKKHLDAIILNQIKKHKASHDCFPFNSDSTKLQVFSPQQQADWSAEGSKIQVSYSLLQHLHSIL